MLTFVSPAAATVFAERLAQLEERTRRSQTFLEERLAPILRNPQIKAMLARLEQVAKKREESAFLWRESLAKANAKIKRDTKKGGR